MSVHIPQRPVALLQLGIIVVEQGTTTLIEFDGEWNLAVRDAARAAISRVLACRPSCVVVDLSRVSSIDASGVRVVVELARRSVLEHVHCVIIPGPPAVQHAFARCRAAGELRFVAHGAPCRSADGLASTLYDPEPGGPPSRHRRRRSPPDPHRGGRRPAN